MFTSEDIGKVITAKDGQQFKIINETEDLSIDMCYCHGCFFDPDNCEGSEIVMDENRQIGCSIYDFIFEKV